MSMLEVFITPRDTAAGHDLDKVQADVMAKLQGIAGVRWQFNDPGAKAVVVQLPADQVTQARSILSARYMVDPNTGLQQL